MSTWGGLEPPIFGFMPNALIRALMVFFFNLRLNKRSKQSWGWWFETQWCSLWRHCNATPGAVPIWVIPPKLILRNLACLYLLLLLSNHFRVLPRACQYHCRVGCKMSKWFDNWNGFDGRTGFREICVWDEILRNAWIYYAPKHCLVIWKILIHWGRVTHTMYMHQ